MTTPLRALASAIKSALDAATRALASANVADQSAKSASKSALDAQGATDTARVHSSNASDAEAVAVAQANAATTQAGVATTQAGIATTQATAATTQAGAAQAASSVALAVAHMYVTTAAAVADAGLTDGSYFSTPGATVGVAAAVYRKSGGAAVDTGIRLPNTDLVPSVLPAESGYAMVLGMDPQGRSVLLVSFDGSVTIPKLSLPSGSVGMAQLSAAVVALLAGALPDESGTRFAIGLSPDGSAPIIGKSDGSVLIPKLQLGAGVVTLANLTAPLQPLLPFTMPDESGWAFAVQDASGRAVGFLRDGTVVGRIGTSTLPDGLVIDSKLSPSVQRRALPQLADVQPVAPDEWRQQTGEVAMTTDPGDGSFWRALSPATVRLVHGVNNSGVPLDIRKTAGLAVMGRSYGGSFDPGLYPSKTYKGFLLNAAVTAPVGVFVAGDYFLYGEGSGLVSTGAYAGMNVGDALVYDGAAWRTQAAPGTFNARNFREWWTVSAAGWFDGLQYAVGDRIMYLSRQTGGGGVQFERWYKGNATKGDVFYRGEFAPSGGLPATPSAGELYQSSAAGAAGGLNFAAGDYLYRSAAGWEVIANDPSTTYVAGASVVLRCGADASEWEVRRTDKSAAVVGLRLAAQMQRVTRGSLDDLLFISDSLYGVSGVGAAVLAATGRNGDVKSYGGSTSDQVAAMLDYAYTQGDPYRARVVVPWHGQNNQPFNEANAAQIRRASLTMARRVGNRESRILFLSVLGQRVSTFNGARLVMSQQEDQFAGVGYLAELNGWYSRTFPGQWISPLAVLLAAAGDTPDPTFPGMTEKQVAAKYGVAPFSFSNGAVLPYPAAQLVFRGYYAVAGLPSGGVDKDYYLRSGGGNVGNLLFNVAGVWQELDYDRTHLSAAAGPALANGGPGSNLGAGYNIIPSSPGVAGFLNTNFL